MLYLYNMPFIKHDNNKKATIGIIVNAKWLNGVNSIF